MQRRSYRWVNTPQEYQQVATSRAGVVPVLLPDSAARQERWQAILEWYGLSKAPDSSLTTTSIALPEINERDPIVCLDASYAAGAQLFASAKSRPFYQLSDLTELDSFIEKANLDSLLLVGPAELWSLRNLRRLTNRLKTPWGVLTAPDLAGFTFLVAKLLAEETANGKWAILNRPHSTLQVSGEDGQAGELEAHNAERLRSLVFEHDWQRLAVLAHGEGGHVTLDEVVLCGLSGEIEQGFGGEEIGGCRQATAELPRQCKRVTDPHIQIAGFGELHTKDLLLFTCSGGVVAGELYPSNVSAVLSALEGYPRAVVATDRVLIIDPIEPLISLNLLEQGYGMGAVRQLLNDLHPQPTRPYFLFGDPAGRSPSFVSPSASGEVTYPAGSPVMLLNLKDWMDKEVTGVEFSNGKADYIRGVTTGAVVMPSDTGILRLLDRTNDWKQQRQQLVIIGQRLRRATLIEQAISRSYPGQLAAVPERQNGLLVLRNIRVAIEELTQAALYSCQLSSLKRLWDEDLLQWTRLCVEQVGEWDAQLARLMADFLFSGQAYLLLSDGFDLLNWRHEQECTRCGSTLNEYETRDPFGGQPKQFRIECPICGGQEGWSEVTGRIQLEFGPALEPGQSAKIHLQLFPAPVVPSTQFQNGWLVVKVHDKLQRTFFKKIVRAKVGQYNFEFSVPLDISPELHMVQAAWVHGLDFTTLRRRWPALVSKTGN